MAVQLKFDDLFFQNGKIARLIRRRAKTKSARFKNQLSSVRKLPLRSLSNDPKCIVKKGTSNLEGLSYYDPTDINKFRKVYVEGGSSVLNTFTTNIQNVCIHNQINNLKFIDQFFKESKMKHTLQMTKKEKQKKIANYFSFK